MVTVTGMNCTLSFPKQNKFVDEVTEKLETGKQTKTYTHEDTKTHTYKNAQIRTLVDTYHARTLTRPHA